MSVIYAYIDPSGTTPGLIGSPIPVPLVVSGVGFIRPFGVSGRKDEHPTAKVSVEHDSPRRRRVHKMARLTTVCERKTWMSIYTPIRLAVPPAS